jgi:hypothetical protein
MRGQFKTELSNVHFHFGFQVITCKINVKMYEQVLIRIMFFDYKVNYSFLDCFCSIFWLDIQNYSTEKVVTHLR